MPSFKLPDYFFRVMPQDVLGRARRMAADLAFGTIWGLWTELLVIGTEGKLFVPEDEFLRRYFEEVWQAHLYQRDETGTKLPYEYSLHSQLLVKLVGMGYLTPIAGKHYIASEKAYALLETSNISIFISYAVRDTSSLAMLLWSELQRRGYSPFLDIRDLSGGDEWHGLLEQKVKGSDVFVLLLGPNTLQSEYVRAEIGWAIDAQRPRIVPIAAPGFQNEMLTDEFQYLASKNMIRVAASTSVDFLSMINQLTASISSLTTVA